MFSTASFKSFFFFENAEQVLNSPQWVNGSTTGANYRNSLTVLYFHIFNFLDKHGPEVNYKLKSPK